MLIFMAAAAALVVVTALATSHKDAAQSTAVGSGAGLVSSYCPYCLAPRRSRLKRSAARKVIYGLRNRTPT